MFNSNWPLIVVNLYTPKKWFYEINHLLISFNITIEYINFRIFVSYSNAHLFFRWVQPDKKMFALVKLKNAHLIYFCVLLHIPLHGKRCHRIFVKQKTIEYWVYFYACSSGSDFIEKQEMLANRTGKAVSDSPPYR